MSGLSNYFVNSLVDQVLRGQLPIAPSTLYVGLLQANQGLWASATTYSAASYVVVGATDGLYHLYYSAAGGTGVGFPTFTGTPGEYVTDGTITWIEQTLAMKSGSAINEPAIGTYAYARVPVVSTLLNWSGTQGSGSTTPSSGASSVTSNNNSIIFPMPTGNWIASPAGLWGIALFDDPLAGNLIAFGPVGSIRTIGSGTSPLFPIGQLMIHLSYPA